jgi:hypothetical protein
MSSCAHMILQLLLPVYTVINKSNIYYKIRHCIVNGLFMVLCIITEYNSFLDKTFLKI